MARPLKFGKGKKCRLTTAAGKNIGVLTMHEEHWTNGYSVICKDETGAMRLLSEGDYNYLRSVKE